MHCPPTKIYRGSGSAAEESGLSGIKVLSFQNEDDPIRLLRSQNEVELIRARLMTGSRPAPPPAPRLTSLASITGANALPASGGQLRVIHRDGQVTTVVNRDRVSTHQEYLQQLRNRVGDCAVERVTVRGVTRYNVYPNVVGLPRPTPTPTGSNSSNSPSFVTQSAVPVAANVQLSASDKAIRAVVNARRARNARLLSTAKRHIINANGAPTGSTNANINGGNGTNVTLTRKRRWAFSTIRQGY